MPETSTPISKWVVEEDALTKGLANLLAQSVTKIDEYTVSSNLEVFGVPVEYVRFHHKDARSAVYCYTIRGRDWKLERKIVIDEHTDIQTFFSGLSWNGSGNYDRWMIDATLIKLHGV